MPAKLFSLSHSYVTCTKYTTRLARILRCFDRHAIAIAKARAAQNHVTYTWQSRARPCDRYGTVSGRLSRSAGVGRVFARVV
jgi:hypothetical protein